MSEGQQIPESWGGEEITVHFSTGSQGARAKGTLTAVNDRGIVLEHRGATFFHPWNTINYLQLGEVEKRPTRIRRPSSGFDID